MSYAEHADWYGHGGFTWTTVQTKLTPVQRYANAPVLTEGYDTDCDASATPRALPVVQAAGEELCEGDGWMRGTQGGKPKEAT